MSAREKLEKIMLRLDINKSQLSQICGYSRHSGVARWFDGYEKDYYPMEFIKRLLKLTENKKYMGKVTEQEIYSLLEPIAVNGFNAVSKSIEVIGAVQAGVWKEVCEYSPDERFQVHIRESIPEAPYFALEVVGDSMDLLYPEGTILLCLSPYDLKSPIQQGDKVIVYRTINGECEATVKELRIDQKSCKAFLMPRSKNPDFQDPIAIDWPYRGRRPGDMDLIEIKGVVIRRIFDQQERDI